MRADIVGKWINVDGGDDGIEFQGDGSLVVAGRKKSEVILGDYTFLNDENFEMTLRFQEGNPWRPRWMPPGVRQLPVVRCYAKFFGDVLELRPRGRIQAKDFDQYIEFGMIRFDPMPEDADK
ncbi:MAG: hypothetical protein WD875_14690 [Pirellulales bacterium]